MSYSAQQINKAFDELPRILNKALLETDIETKEIEIQNKYKIHLDKLTILSNYITLTLIGVMKEKEFEEKILNDLGLSREDSLNIIKDVNEMIFLEVRNKMKEIEEKENLFKGFDNIPNTPTDTHTYIPIPVPPYNKKVEEKNEVPVNLPTLEEKVEKKEIPNDSNLNMIEEKLNKPTTSSNKVSDYSVPRAGSKLPSKEQINTNNKVENKDPYRESF